MKNLLYTLPMFFLAACGSSENAETATEQSAAANAVSFTDAQITNAGITTGKPEMKTISASLSVNGVVDVPPQNLVSVSFPLGGFLKSTDLLPGMKVTRGQVIAVMEDQSFIQMQQDFLLAKARLEMSSKDFERQQTLNANKSVSDKSFEQAQRDFKSEQINVNALREKLLLIGIAPDKLNENTISRTVSIHSPIDGYVSAVNVNIGKYVNPTDVLFELVNPTDLHLALTVFEKDLPLIQPGQKVIAHVANNPSHTFTAEVILVSKKLDENRSAIVHCHFAKGENELLPGMFLTAELELNADSSWCLPEEAIVRSGDAEFVFVEKSKNNFERIPVQTGPSENGWTRILTTGLEGKTVITKNAYAALMKMENKSEE